MDDKRLPKRLFHEDVARGSRQVRRSKDILNTSLKRLEEDSEDKRSDLRSQPHHRREDNRTARKSQLCPPRIANAQPPPTCPCCQLTFRTPTYFEGHLRANCSTRTTPATVSSSSSASFSTPTSNTGCNPEPHHPPPPPPPPPLLPLLLLLLLHYHHHLLLLLMLLLRRQLMHLLLHCLETRYGGCSIHHHCTQF
nr:unnamed protein product [Spirometra erinaceieuropaei]